MRRVFEFIAGNLFVLAIIVASAGAFVAAYSLVVWMNLPDIPHGVLGVFAVLIAISVGAFTAWLGDRLINRRPLIRR